jgi:protein-S-isoprenylcysteine O-methyltransferase Ste14
MSRLAILFLMVVVPALSILLALLGLETLPANLLGWFLLLTGIVYAAGIVIAVYVRREQFWESRLREKKAEEEHGDRSFWLIALGMIGGFFLSPMEYLYFPAILPRPAWIQIPALLLTIFGAALFVWARRALGDSYSGHVSVTEDQRLVQDGPYRFLRHPAYAGYLWISLGLAVGYSSLAGLAAALFALLPAVIYRIRVEEKLLAEHFGAQFDDYARKTKRLIPGVW